MRVKRSSESFCFKVVKTSTSFKNSYINALRLSRLELRLASPETFFIVLNMLSGLSCLVWLASEIQL